MSFIKLENITKTYQLGSVGVPVLKGVSLAVARGEMVALMGSSGSGKTTLMNLLGCLDHPTSGHYWLDGEEVSEMNSDERAVLRSRKIGFVFQSFNLLARTSALDNVIMPLTYAPRHLPEAEAKKRAARLLERVGLGERMDHEPSQLSGGQQQRVAIARSLVNQPSLLFADEPTGNLDSRTSKEVLAMFQDLNRVDGLTIILVTHDAGVASHASRVIHIKDGLIVSGAFAETPTPPSLMYTYFLILRTALRALRRNIMRSALTCLGIVIAVAAVIAMVEIGNGSSAAIQKTISSMGANILMVFPGAATSAGISFGGGSGISLSPDDCDAIARECNAVLNVAPVVRSRGQLVYESKNWVPQNIQGTTESFLEMRDWADLDQGIPFTDQDVRNANKVCIIGQTIAKQLFGDESPLGKEVRLQNVTLKVIGVLSAKGANMMGADQDDILLAPWTTIKYRINGTGGTSGSSTAAVSSTATSTSSTFPEASVALYPAPSASEAADNPSMTRFANVDQILAQAKNVSAIPDAMDQVTNLLRERHHLRAGEPEDFTLRNMTEMTNTLTSTSRLMTQLLLCVAMISLVVGGVGIMNIMMVSVTERTREIGLRMAVGAKGKDILRQFLVEAVVLCLIGGLVGLLFGRMSSIAVTALLHWPTQASVSAALAALGVSGAVGVIFGYYPAWKASRLDPIEALRYE